MSKAKVLKHMPKPKRLRKREPTPFIRKKLRESTKQSAYDEVAAFGRMVAMRKTAGAVRSALGRMAAGGGLGVGVEYLLGDTGLPPLTLAGAGALGGLAAPSVWKWARGRVKGQRGIRDMAPDLSLSGEQAAATWNAHRQQVINKFRQALQGKEVNVAKEAWRQYGPQLERQYGITAAELGL
jgi:hypothetical protein